MTHLVPLWFQQPRADKSRGSAQGDNRRRTFKNPYSVRATNAMGTVEMKQPAIGMKEQMKTKSESRPRPGMASVHMPAAVSAVLTSAMRA